MNEYRVKYHQKPYAYNTPRVMFIKADSSQQAKELACNHIERNLGIPADEFGYETTEVVSGASV